MNESFDSNFKLRYARQLAIPEIGLEGQKKLINSKVLIIGCGALGSMVAMQLAAAGIGSLGLIDYDNIDISNLQRQFFFNSLEIGCSKVEILDKKISALNPEIKTKVFSGIMNKKMAETLFPFYDFIVDATDNPDSKKITGDFAKLSVKPCCIAGVKDFQGQVMTFLPNDDRFEEFFGVANADGFLPCSLGGVLGPAAALAASIQASETIKYLIDTGTLLNGRLLVFNLLSNYFRVLSL